MVKQEEVVIDGASYRITAFTALKGVNIMKRLLKLVGPAGIALTGEGDVLNGKTALETAASALIEGLDRVEVEVLIQELLGSVSKNNMALNIDDEFSANYDRLFQVVFAVIKMNFGSLFSKKDFLGSVMETVGH